MAHIGEEFVLHACELLLFFRVFGFLHLLDAAVFGTLHGAVEHPSSQRDKGYIDDPCPYRSPEWGSHRDDDASFKRAFHAVVVHRLDVERVGAGREIGESGVVHAFEALYPVLVDAVELVVVGGGGGLDVVVGGKPYGEVVLVVAQGDFVGMVYRLFHDHVSVILLSRLYFGVAEIEIGEKYVGAYHVVAYVCRRYIA